MFLDTHSVSLPALSGPSFSDDDYDRLSAAASHCCPNCDGEITLYDDQKFGICRPCHFGADE